MKKNFAYLLLFFTALSTAHAQFDPEPVPFGQVVSETILAQSPPQIAIEVEVALRFASNADAYLKWKPVAGATSYSVRYQLPGSSTWVAVTSATNELILTALPLNANIVWEVLPNGNAAATTYRSDIVHCQIDGQSNSFKILKQ